MPVLSTTILLFLSLALQGSIVLCRRPVFLSETLSLCDKTPPTFQTDFLQSCKLYLTTETCTDAWTAFLNAFVGKNASAVQPGLVKVEYMNKANTGSCYISSHCSIFSIIIFIIAFINIVIIVIILQRL